METFNSAAFRAHGLPETFAQGNHSYSKKGVVRGLHYQLVEPQGTSGSGPAPSSPPATDTCSGVPSAFAHGFSVLSDDAEVLYKCTTHWHQPRDRSILWNDPDLAIDWRVDNPAISPKDAAGKLLREADLFEY
jgi:dTDP-4-dehydrorhamnose 3,5-epimerase